ncbi:AAA family ATPase [Mycoplasmatota bacterium zrk1]
MGKIISVVNQKGGVGKTTTAVNLGAALAYKGKKVLLVDLDPQSNATVGVGINRGFLEYNGYDVLIGDVATVDAIVESSVKNLDILPSTIDLAGLELSLANLEEREFQLFNKLSTVRDNYDYVIIDCPPSLGLVTINALCASNSTLIPVQCEFYALDGLTQLLNTIRIVQTRLRPRKRDLKIEGVLLTMLDNRNNFGFEIVNEVKKYFKEKVFNTIIPRNVQLQIAPSHGKSIQQFSPNSRGAMVYRELAAEVEKNEE